MSIDHWLTVLAILAPVLIGSGGLIWKLMDRMDQKQKKQMEESKKGYELLEKIEKKIEDVDKKVDSVETEVQDHTQSITELKEDQNTIIEKVGLLEDQNQEELRASLLRRFTTFSDRGWITAREKAKWDADYKIYIARGGNGEVAEADKNIQTIPVRTKGRKLFKR